jgi:hypothetical protein
MAPEVNIAAQRGLKDLTDKVKLAVDKAVDQRKELGLYTLPKFDINVCYYGSEGANALSLLVDSNPTIQLNVIPLVENKIKGDKKAYITEILRYFDITRILLGEYDDEENLLEILNNPEDAVQTIEFFLGENELRTIKKKFKTEGNKYSSFRTYAIKGAKPVKGMLSKISQSLKQKFKELPLESLCVSHELDHLCYDNSIIDKKYEKMYERVRDLELDKKLLTDKKLINEYEELNKNLLKLISENTVLTEVRDFFFDCFGYKKLNEIDFDSAKRKVYQTFHRFYLDGCLPSAIIDALIKIECYSTNMNKETAYYLRKKVSEQHGGLDSIRYDFNQNNVDFKIIERLKFEELPRWQRKISDNALIAIDVMGNTFKKNPSRFNEADEKARNFREYLDILES